MEKTVLFWTLAFLITAASAIYQRLTGPTHQLSGKVEMHGQVIKYSLLRSHEITENAPVRIKTGDPLIAGTVEWRRHNTDDSWTKVEMISRNDSLLAELPKQPMAGKLSYRVTLRYAETSIVLPSEDGTVIRFKGDVPLYVLIPHIFAMFGAMLLSTRTGIEFFRKEKKNLARFVYVTIGFLFVGGFILGPLVQKHAFDAYWTGWPFGHDLTDNKTAAALVAWIIVAAGLKKAANPQKWALIAAIVTMAVYLIPHSVLGSELDYKKADKQVQQP
ncbi:MAG: hypothetical protein NTV54_13260 [Ignavibacteriales bacterium]|nr:hypothetical protein [Ignavibacteriales bacterium]